jgi:glycosyltransferase involved in cell wall biosynthesis
LNPAISVIIPVFNGERFLREAVESALAQTYAVREIIVIDDGSTDGSLALAHALPVTVLSQSNQGVSAARNRAIERASGDWLAFLDCDDIWRPHKLKTQIELLQSDRAADYAVSSIHYFVEPGAGLPSWFHVNSHGDYDISYTPSTWLIPRDVWDRVGPFNESMRWVEDIDWLARANDLGLRFVRGEEPLVEKRVRDDSLTANVPEIKKGMLQALRESARRKKESRSSG